MEILYVLIFLSLLMAFLGLMAFLWAAKSGQFDDLKRHAEQFLHDDRATKNSDETY